MLEKRELLNSSPSGLLPVLQPDQLVQHYYTLILERPADPAGLQVFSSALQAGVLPQTIVEQFFGSSEYHTDQVKQAYQTFLHRPADPGSAAFVAWENAGGSPDLVASQLLASGEYAQQTGGTTTGFLTGIYHDLLGRAVDAQGQATFAAALASGVGRAAVAQAVLASHEYHKTEVQVLYRQFLHRPADAGGLQVFTQALDAGIRSAAVSAVLLSSPEFQNLVLLPASGTTPATPAASSSSPTTADVTYSSAHDQATWHDARGDLLTLTAPGYELESVQPLPAPTNAPIMPWGMVNFSVAGAAPGTPVTVTWTLPSGSVPTQYFKEDSSGALSTFAFDGQTGAEIHGNQIEIHLLAGGRGDTSTTPGIITDPGGPAIAPSNTATLLDPQGDTLSLQTDSSLTLSNVQAVTPPTGTADSFPWGLLTFQVNNVPVTAGSAVTVQLTLPAAARPSTYYKYDPTTGTFSPFMFDGVTGAEIYQNIVTLHLVSGGRGDESTQPGVIIDPGGLTGGTNGLPGDIVPQFNDNQLTTTVPGAQGGNPMSTGFSLGSGVRYADGAIAVTMNDLGPSNGFGLPFGQSRSWTNGIYGQGLNGSGMVDNDWPYITQGSTGGTTVAVVTGGVNARTFDKIGSSYTEHEFLTDTLVHNSGTNDFTFTDSSGMQFNFYDFSTSYPVNQRGSLESIKDAAGNATSVTAHTSNGSIQEIQRSSTVGSTTIIDSFLFTYYTSGANSGLLQNVTWRQSSNGGTSWTTLRQVVYGYYDGVTDTSNGNAGDLKTASIEDGSSNVLDESYYRYYVSNSSPGYTNGLKFYFSPESYARLVAAYATPSSATDAQVSPYADLYLQFDSS
jgi:hypothetical protein